MTGRRLAVLVVVVVALAAQVGVAAAVTDSSPPADRSASLAIEQPDYVSQDVSQGSDGNVTVYSVRGPVHDIVPRNFNESRVVDFGVTGPGSDQAALSVDQQFGGFEFRATKPGSYRLYWVVAEPTTTTEVVNQTANGTNQTVRTVQTVQRVRYAARINVTFVDVEHVRSDEFDRIQANSRNWSEWNATIHEPRVAGPDADVETQTKLAVRLLRLRHHPIAGFTGDLGTVIQVLLVTLSGLFLVLLSLVIFVGTRYYDIREHQRREAVDAELGSAEQRLQELTKKQNLEVWANRDWRDIFDSDRIAREFREHFGANPLEGFLRLGEMVLPSTLARDRLQVMGANGWVARVETADGDPDGLATDGGTATGAAIVDAELVERRDLDRDVDPETDPQFRTLEDPSDDLLWAIDPFDETIQSFDLAAADVPDDLKTDLPSLDPDTYIERFIAEHGRLNDPTEAYADYLREFAESVQESNLVTPDGEVDQARMALNVLLQLDRQLFEAERLPTAGFVTDAVEAALVHHDPAGDVEQVIEDTKSGAAAGTGADPPDLDVDLTGDVLPDSAYQNGHQNGNGGG